MTDRLGSERFILNENDTPIAAEVAKYFSTSDQRMDENGGGLSGYVAITQDNLARIIHGMAQLEHELNALKRSQS